MGFDPPIPPCTINAAAPEGTPPRRFECSFYERDSLKNYLAQRGPDEAAERPHQGWETSRTKFNTISNRHEMTMNLSGNAVNPSDLAKLLSKPWKEVLFSRHHIPEPDRLVNEFQSGEQGTLRSDVEGTPVLNNAREHSHVDVHSLLHAQPGESYLDLIPVRQRELI